MASYLKLYPVAEDNDPNTPPWFFPSSMRASPAWDSDPISGRDCALIGYEAGTGNNNVLRSEIVTTNPYRLGFYRWVMRSLEAQTISGTVDMVLGVLETSASANFASKVCMYVTAGETDTVRGTLLNYEDTAEWPTTGTGIGFSAPQALSSVDCEAGDCFVIEFGAIVTNSTSSSMGGRVYAGMLHNQIDLTLGSTNVTTERGFFVFSNAILVDDPAPTTGDIIAGNEELFIYDAAGNLVRIVIPSNAAAGEPDPSNGLQLSDGRWVFPTEATDTELLFYSSDLSELLTVVDMSPGDRARSLTLDEDDNIYVGFRGNLNTNPTGTTYHARKFNSAGVLQQTYDLPFDVGGSGPSSIDLAADGRTLIYVSRSRTVRRYDVVDDAPLADFAILPTEAGPDYSTQARAFGVRWLPDGGCLVADLIDVKRLNANGSIVKRYTRPNVEDWQSISIGPGAVTFAAGTIGAPNSSAITSGNNPNVQGATGPNTALIAVFNLATGALVTEMLDDIDPDTGGSQRGLTTSGGWTPPGTGGSVVIGAAESVDLPIRRVRIGPHLYNGTEMQFVSWAQLDCVVGKGLTSGTYADAEIVLKISRDGGNTFGVDHVTTLGALGNYMKRVRWQQLGQGRDLVFMIIMSAPIDISIENLWIQARGGTS